MPKLRLKISMSLDGFVAGPNQSVEDPLGIGGEQLHEWVVGLAAWRKPHGLEGGKVNASSAVMEESLVNIGATIMGRNMFGGHPGPVGPRTTLDRLVGRQPAVPSSRVRADPLPARAAVKLQGGTTFTFVTDGIESALEQARRAARGKDVTLAGGASACSQYLDAGLVDEMEISLVPILLGSGERLFEGAGDDLHGLRPVRTVATAEVTHLKFARP